MFHGSIVALLTPMLDGQVDVMRLRELVDYQIAEGTQGIVAAGTTGEAGTLSTQEKLLVIKTVIDQSKERVPVIAGTAMNATKDCIHLTTAAMELGAHAALIMTPAYIKPTQDGLYQHYRLIAEAVAIPIILYNVPNRTSCDLSAETVAKLSSLSNIVGIKDATGELARLTQLLHLCHGAFDVYSGDDTTAAAWLCAGAKAVISVTANIAPRRMAELSALALAGQSALCATIDAALQPLHKMLFVESNPIAIKWAAHRMGLINNEIRLPMTHLSVPLQRPLETILFELGLIRL